MTSGARRLSFQMTAHCNMKLKLDQIEPGSALGYRMFDLQPRVHFHERELLGFRLVQKFHGARVAIVGRLAQAHCRVA